jgi:hypothetical protein
MKMPMSNIDEKMNKYFSNVIIKMSSKPAKHLTHLYADYLEIVSLFSNSNYISSSDLIDRFKDEGLISRKDHDAEQAEENDRHEQWVNQIFEIIIERKILFQDDYPFEILNNNKIKLKTSALNNRHKIYLFLLLSSCLYLFEIFTLELTKEFESVCYEALLKFLPTHATVKSFGKNSDYSGSAIQKINQLAIDLKIKVNESSTSKISPVGNQERGLDIVGWISFQDSVANFLSIFCQCACGKEWYKKLHETRRYENYYEFHRNKPVHVMFIPYALINHQHSDFHQADEITDTLLFERGRILNFIFDDSFFNDLDSKIIVEKCIAYEEDIV